MNLFFLSHRLEVSPTLLCDKHIVKMILETAQLLWCAWHCQYPNLDQYPHPIKVYRKTHTNHPTSIWVRACEAHYQYAIYYGMLACLEYTKRYHKVHACQKHFEYLNHLGFPGNDSNESQKEKTILATKDIPHGLQYIPLCMPHEHIVYDEQKQPLGIASYQKYYISKQHAFKMTWTKTKTPSFFIKYNNVS